MRIINRSTASPALGLKRVKAFNFSHDNKIGQGGYAKVFPQTGRNGSRIAVKIDDPYIASTGYLNYFIEREAQALFRFDHPNIVTCLAYGNSCKKMSFYDANGSFQVKGQSFAAFEYLGNYQSAKVYIASLAKGRLSAALEMFKKVVLALEQVHVQGWVHADIKETNIMTDGKNVKLIDFAFARPEGERIDRAETDQWALGTRAYMSLARLKKVPPTKADDLFSLGIVLGDLMLNEIVAERDDRLSNAWGRSEIGRIFQELQKKIDRKIASAKIPRKIKELMRRTIGLGKAEPFTGCSEILKYLDQNQLALTA